MLARTRATIVAIHIRKPSRRKDRFLQHIINDYEIFKLSQGEFYYESIHAKIIGYRWISKIITGIY